MDGPNDLTKLTRKGFTLIELIVVMAIIAILAAMLGPDIYGYIERAKNRADASAASTICKAIQIEMAIDSDRIEEFTRNPWLGGTNKDGSQFDPDDHGYVYVDKNEVRVSSYGIAKLLEENGYIDSAGPKPTDDGIHEYKFPKSQCNGLICKSNRNWYRYQININNRGDEIYFTFSANSKSGERHNTAKMSSADNFHDQEASEKFAAMAGGEADDLVSLPNLY
ncbi:type II secretion system protein [Ruminococcus flavefaciens]|uniref:type II secretion system protein n=1 Tax=Ruminococcus flavefaciens TaxID=1265 RepID=UPI0026EF0C4E|nr:type II secretion system protein [Ruminococcus flavefaciens]